MALPTSDRDHPHSAVTILLRRLRCRRTGHLLSQEDNSMLHVNRTSACLVFALFLTSFSLSARADTVGGQQYDFIEMKALVDEAHVLGLKVVVHAHGTSGIKDAIRAGVDTIEHASLADEEAFALAKQHGTYFSMDIYDDDYILAQGEKNGVFKESLEKERMIGRKQRETFHAAQK